AAAAAMGASLGSGPSLRRRESAPSAGSAQAPLAPVLPACAPPLANRVEPCRRALLLTSSTASASTPLCVGLQPRGLGFETQ
ncbi:hypothetical protein ZWY2020_048412, partial [Hordeum vulgare]